MCDYILELKRLSVRKIAYIISNQIIFSIYHLKEYIQNNYNNSNALGIALLGLSDIDDIGLTMELNNMLDKVKAHAWFQKTLDVIAKCNTIIFNIDKNNHDRIRVDALKLLKKCYSYSGEWVYKNIELFDKKDYDINVHKEIKNIVFDIVGEPIHYVDYMIYFLDNNGKGETKSDDVTEEVDANKGDGIVYVPTPPSNNNADLDIARRIAIDVNVNNDTRATKDIEIEMVGDDEQY